MRKQEGTNEPERFTRRPSAQLESAKCTAVKIIMGEEKISRSVAEQDLRHP